MSKCTCWCTRDVRACLLRMPLFFGISQEWWKQFTFVEGLRRGDCSFSGSIKRTLDGFLSSPTAASRRCKKAMNQTWRLLSQHAHEKKAAEAIVSEISVKMIDYAVYKFRTMFPLRQRRVAGSAERWAGLPADRTPCECEACHIFAIKCLSVNLF